MAGALTRADAEAADARDPLAPFRDRFVIAGETIYLDGNSLGRLPVATRDRLAAMAAEWGEQLVRGWHDWIDAPARAGDLLAPIVGARPGEVVVCDSTTVNLYKLVSAAIDARAPRTLVTSPDNFPTDRYVLEGLARQRGLAFRLDDEVRPGDLAVISHVAYRSGELLDLAGIQAAAQDATIVWDLCHSAGAVPVNLHEAGAELAVGCTYKYLNAGPGAPAFLYVAEERQPELRSPIWGWFGQRDQFAMERPYDPEPGIGRFLAGTPNILAVAAVEEGAKLTAAAGIDALRAKSIALTERIVALHDAWLVPLGFSLETPRDPARRGSHVAIRHDEAWQASAALIERADVVPDFRGPDTIRLGVAPLYIRHVDVHDAMQRLRDLVALGAHRELPAARGRVT